MAVELCSLPCFVMHSSRLRSTQPLEHSVDHSDAAVAVLATSRVGCGVPQPRHAFPVGGRERLRPGIQRSRKPRQAAGCVLLRCQQKVANKCPQRLRLCGAYQPQKPNRQWDASQKELNSSMWGARRLAWRSPRILMSRAAAALAVQPSDAGG